MIPRQLRQILALPSKQRSVLPALLLCCGMASAQQQEVTLAVFAYQGERTALADWADLASYLGRTVTGYRFRLKTYDAPGLRRAVATGEADLVITNPGYYIALETEAGLSRIATLSSPAMPAIASVILTRADRIDLSELSDLAGKRLAAASPDAFAGYLVAARELRDAGVDTETDLGELRFVGLPMFRTIEAIMEGEVDAGIVKACMAEQMISQGLLQAAELKAVGPHQNEGFPCMASTRLYPDWPIAVARHVDPVLAKAVALALLAMPEGEGRISWTVAADYQPVHELYRTMRLGPYVSLRELTPQQLLLKYWRWLVALLVLLAFWALHTLRVRQLVTRRTAQLRHSLHKREEAERRARDKQEQLDHMGRLSILGELSGNLAHEISQPLATIATYARSLLRRQRSGRLVPDALHEACSEIAAEAERAGAVIQRIRSFARKRPSTRSKVDLGEVALEAVRLVQAVTVSPVPIAICSAPRPDEAVHADALQIQQVLLNLLKNAIDAGCGLPAARQAITIEFDSTAHQLLTRVSDRGAGIDAARYRQLFDAFFTTKSDGLGLGLSICKSIIESHGGQLWAEMNDDQIGMRFMFTLPRQPAYGQTSPLPSRSA